MFEVSLGSVAHSDIDRNLALKPNIDLPPYATPYAVVEE